MGYLANFIVYTLAMVGVIVVALLVFKNATSIGTVKSSKYLSIVDSLQLAPRKNLYIVSTGKEKFLIASDADKTNLISKIDLEEIQASAKSPLEASIATFKDTITNINKDSYMDKSSIGIRSSILSGKNSAPYNSVIKSLADRIK